MTPFQPKIVMSFLFVHLLQPNVVTPFHLMKLDVSTLPLILLIMLRLVRANIFIIVVYPLLSIKTFVFGDGPVGPVDLQRPPPHTLLLIYSPSLLSVRCSVRWPDAGHAPHAIHRPCPRTQAPPTRLPAQLPSKSPPQPDLAKIAAPARPSRCRCPSLDPPVARS
jgi:hypothetical protein